MPKGAMIWETLLCKVDMPDGRARILGTALVVAREEVFDRDPDALQAADAFASTPEMPSMQSGGRLWTVDECRWVQEKLAG